MTAWSKDQFRGNDRKRAPKLEDMVDLLRADKNFKRLRPIGPYQRVAEHWIPMRSKEGKVYTRFKQCLAYDPISGKFSGKCPYCEAFGDTPRVVVLLNVINRNEQKREPRKKPKPLSSERKEVTLWDGKSKAKLKEHGSDTWTPVQVIRLPGSAASSVADMASINTVSKKNGEVKAHGPEHNKYGFDLVIKRDEDAPSPAQQYSIQKGERTPLTEDELNYHVWNLGCMKPEKYDEALNDARFIGKYFVTRGKDGSNTDNPIDVDEVLGLASPKKKGKSKEIDADDLDQDDQDNEPRKKKKKKKKGKPDKSSSKKKKKKSKKGLDY